MIDEKETVVIDENIKNTPIVKEESVDLNMQTKQIVSDIIAVENQESLKDLVNLFNLNQSKKNALRVAKLNELLDKIEDQAIERFDKSPGKMSNRDLLDYLKAVEESIDRSQKYVDTVKDEPMIQINNQTNINVEAGSTFDRESRERVIEAVKALLENIQEGNTLPPVSDVIDEGEEHDNN